MEKGNHLALLVGMQSDTATMENSVEISLKKKKKKIKLPYDPAIPLLGIYLEKTTILKVTCTPMFIAAQFTKARIWKQPRCPLATKWIKKLCYIYTMEYYSAIKRNGFESVLVRWMDLESLMQS